MQVCHRDEGQQHGHRQDENRHKGATQMKQKDHRNQADDDTLLHKLLTQHGNGPMDQVRPVVGRNDVDAFGQGRRDLCQPGCDPFDHGERVLSGPHDHDAADRLALAVQFSNAPTLVRPDLDMGDIPNQDRRASPIRPDWDQLNILNRPQIAAPTNHVFRAGHFQNTATHLRIAVPDRLDNRLDRQPVSGQRVRVYFDLILLDESADRRHFRHARHTFQLIAQVPILKTAKLRQVVCAGLINQCILIDPPDAGRVRAESR